MMTIYFFVLTNALKVYIIYIYTNHKGCDVLNIIISNSGGLPIYEQIYEQIKAAIISGELKENDILPSIRGLAKDMRISVITTKRAYEELERNGYIYTKSGKGSFVAKRSDDLAREEYLREIEYHLLKIKKLSAAIGIDKNELMEMFDILEDEQ